MLETQMLDKCQACQYVIDQYRNDTQFVAMVGLMEFQLYCSSLVTMSSKAQIPHPPTVP